MAPLALPCRGFTLLETLVVLVMTSLIIGILMQGFSQSVGLQRRLGMEQVQAEQGTMLVEWFRNSVQGLQPDYADGKQVFKGDGRSISGMTISPPSRNYGAVESLKWDIAFDSEANMSRLRWGSADSRTIFMSWPGGSGRFRYLDGQGTVHEAWPPPLGINPQLPRAVVFEYEWNGMPETVVATIMGPSKPRIRARDVINALGGK